MTGFTRCPAYISNRSGSHRRTELARENAQYRRNGLLEKAELEMDWELNVSNTGES
jgi:hypothetical protein